MDLDQLKESWKAGVPEEMNTSRESLQAMLQKKSKRPIARMIRNVYWEVAAVVVLYSLTAVFSYWVNRSFFMEMSIFLLIVGLLGLYYYYRKLRILKEMECVVGEVKSNLQRQVTLLEKYIRFYLIAGTVLAPLAYFFSGIVVLFQSPMQLVNPTRFYTFFAGAGIILTVVAFFLNKWYVQKLYGQHVAQLKSLLEQFEES